MSPDSKSSPKFGDIFREWLNRKVNPKIETVAIRTLLCLGLLVAGAGLNFIDFDIKYSGHDLSLSFASAGGVKPWLLAVGIALLLAGSLLAVLLKILYKHVVTIEGGRSCSPSPFSFTSDEFIHPNIIQDLVGWISDGGDQVVSINLLDANKLNRYYGHVTTKTLDDKIIVECRSESEYFSYSYEGSSESGIHVLTCSDWGGGSGIFRTLLFVSFEVDETLDLQGEELVKRRRLLIKSLGHFSLGDRYAGKIKLKSGYLYVGRDEKHAWGRGVDLALRIRLA